MNFGQDCRSVRKNRRQIFSRTDRANEVNKTFIIWLLVHFLLCLQHCARVQMLPFIFPLSFLVSLRHLFPSLIYKQLSRKATLMFQDVLLFERFQRTLPNSFLFSFKSTYKFSCPNLQVRKKSYCPLTSPVMAIRFFPHLSATNQRAS